MSRIAGEIRESLRIFVRQPGFAAVVVLTLALGIGANTAIFSLIYGILLRPFPYSDPSRLVRIQSVYTKTTGQVRPNSLMDVEDWRKRTRTLVEVGAYSGSFDSDLRGEGPAEPIHLDQLNPQALLVLGVKPIMGRLFLPEEDKLGGDVHKAILGYRLWRDRFASDPNIVGKTIQTNQAVLTVVGVMPPGFGFPDRTDVWTPMESYYTVGGVASAYRKRDSRIYSVIARLKPGVTLAQAQADMDGVAVGLEQEYPKENRGVRPRLIPLRDVEVGDIRPYLLALLAAAGFVLLICCANVANLLLARGAGRSREIAIRAALGAGRGSIIRAHLVESAVLGFAGGLLGVALAFAGVKALLALIPVALPLWMKIEVDLAVLSFAAIASLATGLLFGLIPAIAASGVDLHSLLKEGSRGSSGRSSRLRSALVIAEVALSVLLLVGAGLMMGSLLRLKNVSPGFKTDSATVVRVTKFQTGSTRAERSAVLSAFHDRVLDRLRQIPGVSAAVGTNGLPYAGTQEGRSTADLVIKGQADQEMKQTLPLKGADVSIGYLETMGIPLLQGRYFDRRDTSASPMAVIVNERAARTLWPGRDPIGQQIRWGAVSPENPFCTVVGVVANIHYHAAEADNGLELYYPYTQYGVSSIYYVLRSSLPLESVGDGIRSAVRAIDKNAAIVWMKPIEQIMDESLWQRRLWGVLFAAFASFALMLAAIGIYGVMSYMVSQQTREIGIRVALGASRTAVLGLVIGNGFMLVLTGLAGGLCGAFALSRLIRNLLFGVTATDPVTYAGVPLFLIAVALLACYIPARRAASVDPLIALREE
jgi:putative ABC transport system permease protein